MGRIDQIEEKINTFRKKYYINLLVRGLILTLTVLLAYFILAALFEFAFWLNGSLRFFILLSFFVLAGYCFWRFLSQAVLFLFSGKGIDNEQSARLIGERLPTISDKLLNLVQLLKVSGNSSLAYASVTQKAGLFEPIRFDTVIDLRENLRYLRYLVIPVIVVVLLLVLNSNMLTQSAHRILHYNQAFTPTAPFQFIVTNKSFTAYRNEDFTVSVTLEGTALPESVYLTYGTHRLKMETVDGSHFVYTFEKIQEPKTIRFEAAGFYSTPFEIILAERPELTRLTVTLEYPPYLHRKNDVFANAGNLEVPDGTVITWQVQTANANSASIQFGEQAPDPMQLIDNQSFTLKKQLRESVGYEVKLENKFSTNKDRIAYSIGIITDQFPQINVNNFNDSVFYRQIVLGGMVSDDYGLSELRLHFSVKDARREEVAKKSLSIPIYKNQQQQSFLFNWRLDSLQLKPGEHLEYYLQVWDNDGVNGRKSTRSASYSLFIPDRDQITADISRSQSKAEQALHESAEQAEQLRKDIEDANQKLKGKQTLDWQEKKRLEELIEQRKNLDQLIRDLNEANKLLEKKKESFTEQDERIRQKAEQIQKLMDELLDEETKKLLEELQKLLRENANVSEIQKLMDKLNRNSKNLENELERTLELFKQLQFEYKMDQVIKDLQKDADGQKELLEKTKQLEEEGKEKGNIKNEEKTAKAQELAKEQQALSEEFRKTAEKIEELNQLAEELDNNQDLPDQVDVDQIDELQHQSKENLQQNAPDKSRQQQQKAIQKMSEMQQKMEEMQNAMEMDMQNIESLRQIIHGLVKLSFDQESLLNQFNELQVNDPRFNSLAQKQLKLKDDVKVLEDSLLALSKRDEMMGSFITREINELNDHLTKAIDANRERRRQPALSEMQFSMTSINNLALMLDSHFDMMMQMLANAKPSMKSKKKGKEPNLSQLQQQLNNRIEQLKNSGKQGRQLSEELAQMAAEQERIRRALQEMQEKMQQKGTDVPGSDIPDKMEESELDLVNKQLTDQLIQRQREILTRLLEAERSMREQDFDEERKGETAKDYQNEIPKAIEDYLKLKEREVELLKTMPPKLYPFYRKEVSEYFKRLREN
ncbi:MAG: hypothetical protein HRU69_04385 [Flammeovirgaceae bacterium]|nr:MAG: hypothetical protein HRU69_04385 [Flammeovirgaceae bacterium]